MDTNQKENEFPQLTNPIEEKNQKPEKTQVTFRGNSYDLASVIAVTTGALALLSCLTLYMGIYCFPLVPLVLGVIGLMTAKNSVDPRRTQILSWIGVGTGSFAFILVLLGILFYFGFLFLTLFSFGELF
ncbi:MAG: hypothetical protein JEZ06_18710 [Anaerolineaceae bacterium]|nr:hypothetical protein [Anaerolineaceae bacterium]